MYNSIGINLQKELNYLGKRVKIPKITAKSNCCCDHDHFSKTHYYTYTSQPEDSNNEGSDFKEDMNKMLCPVRDFMNNNKKFITMTAGILLITLAGIKILKELS
ncbi:MAG: hypothetical protein SPJ62_11015 [Inconstantimicrobium porci]|uniref:Uncharacterized protein n=1 Tax=Inconstantimicrobium porci TaxID=2652291 RepID=A0A7X2MVK5_9CLOT|nr:hypothetical protein [Inconstantimicrobium porci]MDD6770215.1 hypothetical protein [Inconstantimicrobium porci]MDY5912509.1 hypothetical protein [Inconstantimicrobium porci]MSR89854.1 hypothetical protein [Inconstantimicrobium porci]